MELPNKLHRVLHDGHILDEVRNQLYEHLDLVANFPAFGSDYFIEEVSSVGKTHHGVTELRVAVDLRVLERILIG